MGTCDPIKSNCAKEKFGSSKRLRGIEEINEKKLA